MKWSQSVSRRLLHEAAEETVDRRVIGGNKFAHGHHRNLGKKGEVFFKSTRNSVGFYYSWNKLQYRTAVYLGGNPVPVADYGVGCSSVTAHEHNYFSFPAFIAAFDRSVTGILSIRPCYFATVPHCNKQTFKRVCLLVVLI